MVAQSLTSSFSTFVPRVALPVSGNVESDIVQLFPSDLWTLRHLGPPYRLSDHPLCQSGRNLIVVRLPAVNHLSIENSFKRIGKCVYYLFVYLFTCQNVAYNIHSTFTVQQAGQTGRCTALMSAVNLD